MLHERCERDPDWANQPQWIVPRLALRPEEHIQKDMRRFDRLVRDRLTAGHIAAAFLKQAEHGAAPELPPGAARLSRNALAASVLDDLCMADPGNVLTRVWRPSRPVIHLCAAWAVSLRELDEASRKKPVLVGPLRDRIFLATVLARAEAYVPILARIDPPIPEDDLIRLRPQVG
jgi:hypothetical protein